MPFEVMHLTLNKGSGAMGFSINFTPDKLKPGFLSVGTVRQGSPAALAGMLKDDYLLEVDGKDLQYASKDEGTAAIKDTGAVVQVAIGRIAAVCVSSLRDMPSCSCRSRQHQSRDTVWMVRLASCSARHRQPLWSPSPHHRCWLHEAKTQSRSQKRMRSHPPSPSRPSPSSPSLLKASPRQLS